MLSPYSITAYFTVADLKLPVSHFSLMEAISTPSELKVELPLSEVISLASWLGQSVGFSIQNDMGETRQWHLRCKEASLMQKGRGYWLTVIAQSAWGSCFEKERLQRVFCHAVVPDLVRSMLGEPSMWRLSHEAWERKQIVQCSENDGEFIQRICGRENIQWFARYDDQQERLHFIDHPRFLEQRPQKILEEEQRMGVFELHYIQRQALQDHEWQNNLPMRLYSGIPCMQAGMNTSGMPVKTYRALSYEPDLFNKAVRERAINFSDMPMAGYRAVHMQSNLMDLAPGLIIDLAQGLYRVNYILHAGNSTENGELMMYKNTVIAQDMQSPWRGILHKRPLMPLVFQAKIESAHEFPYLDANGRETVRSVLDSHPSKNIKASIPIPRLTPYAHDRGGMNFPLYAGTEVLMTCLHGEPDLPIILGAVYNNAPVNANNPWINMIRTQQSQSILFDDTPNNPSISLSTQSGHGWIQRNGSQPGFFVICIGGMIIRSHGNFTWQTGKNFSLGVGETYQQKSASAQQVQTQKGNITCKAAENIQSHALRHIEVEAKRHKTVLCRHKNIIINNNQTILIEQGDSTLSVQGASLIEVNQTITLHSMHGDLILRNQSGACEIKLTQSGQIYMRGKQFIANTELQKHAGTINHY